MFTFTFHTCATKPFVRVLCFTSVDVADDDDDDRRVAYHHIDAVTFMHSRDTIKLNKDEMSILHPRGNLIKLLLCTYPLDMYKN